MERADCKVVSGAPQRSVRVASEVKCSEEDVRILKTSSLLWNKAHILKEVSACVVQSVYYL